MAEETNTSSPKKDELLAATTGGENNATPTTRSGIWHQQSSRKEPPTVTDNDDHSNSASAEKRSILDDAKEQLAYPVGKLKAKARPTFLPREAVAITNTRLSTCKNVTSLESNLTNSSKSFVSNIAGSDDDSEMLREAKRGIMYPRARRPSSFNAKLDGNVAEVGAFPSEKSAPRRIEEPDNNRSGTLGGTATFESFSDRGQRKLARLSVIRGRPLETAAASATASAATTAARLSIASTASDDTETMAYADRGQRKLARLSMIRGRPLATNTTSASSGSTTARLSLSTESDVSDRGQRKLARLSMIRGRPLATTASATAATRLSIASSMDGSEHHTGTTTITNRGQTKLAKLSHSRGAGGSPSPSSPKSIFNQSDTAEVVENRFVGAWFVRHDPEGILPATNDQSSAVVSSDTVLSTTADDTTPGGGGLAVANLVTQADEPTTRDIPVAEEMENDTDGPNSKHHETNECSVLTKASLLFCLGVFVVVVVVLLTNVLPLDDTKRGEQGITGTITNSTSSDIASSSSDTDASIWSSPEDYLKSLLPSYTLDVIGNGTQQYNSSPQYRAFDWARKDPFLFNYSSWRTQQRFALATFYYASDGDAWANNYKNRSSGWLDYNKHECQWTFSEEVYSATIEFYGYSITDPCNYNYDNDDTYTTDTPSNDVYNDLFFPRRYQSLVLPMWNGVGTKEGSLQHLAPEVFQLLPFLIVMVPIFDEGYSGIGFHGSLPSEIGFCQQLEVSFHFICFLFSLLDTFIFSFFIKFFFRYLP